MNSILEKLLYIPGINTSYNLETLIFKGYNPALEIN